MDACAANACSAGAGPTSGTQRPGLDLQSLVPLVGADRYADEIGALRARAEQIRAARKRVAQLMRNERRKRQRLIKKSQKLSNNDLLQVLQMRGQKEREAAVPAEEEPPSEDPPDAPGTGRDEEQEPPDGPRTGVDRED